jgi:hypothetical protein
MLEGGRVEREREREREREFFTCAIGVGQSLESLIAKIQSSVFIKETTALLNPFWGLKIQAIESLFRSVTCAKLCDLDLRSENLSVHFTSQNDSYPGSHDIAQITVMITYRSLLASSRHMHHRAPCNPFRPRLSKIHSLSYLEGMRRER